MQSPDDPFYYNELQQLGFDEEMLRLCSELHPEVQGTAPGSKSTQQILQHQQDHLLLQPTQPMQLDAQWRQEFDGLEGLAGTPHAAEQLHGQAIGSPTTTSAAAAAAYNSMSSGFIVPNPATTAPASYNTAPQGLECAVGGKGSGDASKKRRSSSSSIAPTAAAAANQPICEAAPSSKQQGKAWKPSDLERTVARRMCRVFPGAEVLYRESGKSLRDPLTDAECAVFLDKVLGCKQQGLLPRPSEILQGTRSTEIEEVIGEFFAGVLSYCSGKTITSKQYHICVTKKKGKWVADEEKFRGLGISPWTWTIPLNKHSPAENCTDKTLVAVIREVQAAIGSSDKKFEEVASAGLQSAGSGHVVAAEASATGIVAAAEAPATGIVAAAEAPATGIVAAAEAPAPAAPLPYNYITPMAMPAMAAANPEVDRNDQVQQIKRWQLALQQNISAMLQFDGQPADVIPAAAAAAATAGAAALVAVLQHQPSRAAIAHSAVPPLTALQGRQPLTHTDVQGHAAVATGPGAASTAAPPAAGAGGGAGGAMCTIDAANNTAVGPVSAHPAAPQGMVMNA